MSDHNSKIAEQFYNAFSRLNAEEMISLYSDDASFSDPIFPELSSTQTKAMWRMLCSSAKDFSLTYSVKESTDQFVIVHWDALYTFSSTGRHVENRVKTQLRIRGGKIYEHKDEFNFSRWSRQALGPIAFVLGYFPFFQTKVQLNASQNLQKFMTRSS